MSHGFYFYRWWGKTIDQKSVEIKSRWKSCGCWLAEPLVSWVTRYPSHRVGVGWGGGGESQGDSKAFNKTFSNLIEIHSKDKMSQAPSPQTYRIRNSDGGTSHFCFTNSEAHYGSHLFEKPYFSQRPSKWSPGVHLGSSELFSPYSSWY